MKEEIYRWRFIEKDEDTDEIRVESSTEEFKSMFELWDELLLMIFHPNINLFGKYSVNSIFDILIWKKGEKAIKLTLFLDLENYFVRSEEVAACLGITVEDISRLLVLKTRYLYKYNRVLYRQLVNVAPLIRRPVFIEIQ